jgi:hypothetical protein
MISRSPPKQAPGRLCRDPRRCRPEGAGARADDAGREAHLRRRLRQDPPHRIRRRAVLRACAERRPPGIALVRLESLGGQVGQRRMRIGIVNDDMPFLVDSVANAIAARGLIIHRLLHPVVCVERDGRLPASRVEPRCDEAGPSANRSCTSRSTAPTRAAGATSSPSSTACLPTCAPPSPTGGDAGADARDAALVADPKARAAALVRRRRDDPARLPGRAARRAVRDGARPVPPPRRPDRREAAALGAMRYFEEGGRSRWSPRPSASRPCTAACRSTWSSCRSARMARSPASASMPACGPARR